MRPPSLACFLLPAGVFGAINACEQAASLGSPVDALIVEMGEPLSKVRISGGGRCNVMHDESKQPADIATNYPRGSRELLGPLTSHFGAAQAAGWFRGRGVVLKTEADGRMFPVTDDSATIAECLLGAAASAGVKIQSRTKVTSIKKSGESRFEVEIGQGATKEKLVAECVLLCPGSSQEAWTWISALGHKVTGFHCIPLLLGQLHAFAPRIQVVEPVPSLFTLTLAECNDRGGGYLAGLAGITVPHVTLSLIGAPSESEANEAAEVRPKSEAGVAEAEAKSMAKSAKRKRKRGSSKKRALVTTSGPLLLTHTGVSGPAALRLSAFGARLLADSKYKGSLTVNWCEL